MKWTSADPKSMKCTCEHSFQDKAYGTGFRLHNPYQKGYRCTVCGSEKSFDWGGKK